MENKKIKLEPQDIEQEEAKHEPVPENSAKDDCSTLVSIFPEKIWKIILDKDFQSTDLEHISNASLFFRTLLLPNRVTFLFPNVAKILASQYFQKHGISDAYNETTLLEVYQNDGYVFKKQCAVCRAWVYWQWFSSILKTRLVCKAWCISVNTVLHSLDTKSQKKEWSEFSFNRDVRRHFGIRKFTFNPVISLLSRNANINCVPFIGSEYIKYGKSLLRKFGHYFHHCQLEFWNVSTSSAQGYYMFHQVLGFLPNLKSLSVSYLHHSYNPNATLPDPDEDLAELQNSIGLYPLPKLENLEKVVSSNFDSPMLYELSRVARNVNNLKIFPFSDKFTNGNIDFDKLHLPKLDTFSLGFVSDLHISVLAKAQTVWPLKTLELNFHHKSFISWDVLFPVIENKWADTLINLRLSLPDDRNDDVRKKQIVIWSKKLRLNLPKLKNLELLVTNLHSLDFILPLKNNLELLTLSMLSNYDTEKQSNLQIFDEIEKNQIIQFVGYTTRNKMLDSNVWQIFSNLKQITYWNSANAQWVITREQVVEKKYNCK